MKDLRSDSTAPDARGCSGNSWFLPPVLAALVIAAQVCRTLRLLALVLAIALAAQIAARALVARTSTLLCFLPDVSAFALAGRNR